MALLARSDQIIVEDVEVAGRPARRLTLNRPAKCNCLTVEMLQILATFVSTATNRLIIISAVGRAFCSGLDLDELETRRSPADQLDGLVILFKALNSHSSPVVSLINGMTIAGGVGLALSADVVIADTTAILKVPDRAAYLPMAKLLLPWLKARRTVASDKIRGVLADGICAGAAKELGIVDQVCDGGTTDLMMAKAVEELNNRMMVMRNDIPDRVPNETFAKIQKLRDEATSTEAVRRLMHELARRRLNDK